MPEGQQPGGPGRGSSALQGGAGLGTGPGWQHALFMPGRGSGYLALLAPRESLPGEQVAEPPINSTWFCWVPPACRVSAAQSYRPRSRSPQPPQHQVPVLAPLPVQGSAPCPLPCRMCHRSQGLWGLWATSPGPSEAGLWGSWATSPGPSEAGLWGSWATSPGLSEVGTLPGTTSQGGPAVCLVGLVCACGAGSPGKRPGIGSLGGGSGLGPLGTRQLLDSHLQRQLKGHQSKWGWWQPMRALSQPPSLWVQVPSGPDWISPWTLPCPALHHGPTASPLRPHMLLCHQSLTSFLFSQSVSPPCHVSLGPAMVPSTIHE
uniref:uncharacterized protein LOC120892047 n=1 Tax=Ictidomys tridecemlineatus TaxID=43179 RepID=UPI001A9DA56E|nr:uncharacterized protein LOC120892047 [Ictidomys tridecemlineatus]